LPTRLDELIKQVPLAEQGNNLCTSETRRIGAEPVVTFPYFVGLGCEAIGRKKGIGQL
jgi:hypothetical protein